MKVFTNGDFIKQLLKDKFVNRGEISVPDENRIESSYTLYMRNVSKLLVQGFLVNAEKDIVTPQFLWNYEKLPAFLSAFEKIVTEREKKRRVSDAEARQFFNQPEIETEKESIFGEYLAYKKSVLTEKMQPPLIHPNAMPESSVQFFDEYILLILELTVAPCVRMAGGHISGPGDLTDLNSITYSALVSPCICLPGLKYATPKQSGMLLKLHKLLARVFGAPIPQTRGRPKGSQNNELTNRILKEFKYQMLVANKVHSHDKKSNLIRRTAQVLKKGERTIQRHLARASSRQKKTI